MPSLESPTSNPRRSVLRSLFVWIALVACGCAAPPPPPAPPPHPLPLAALHLTLERPLGAVPDPNDFARAALIAFTEHAIRNGYDPMGRSVNRDGDAGAERLLGELNQRRPGTGLLRLQLLETPNLVGGVLYVQISYTLLAPHGATLAEGDLPLPRYANVLELFFPSTPLDVRGRDWARLAWHQELAQHLPPRGLP